MIVEVNSDERAAVIRQLIEERLANDATFQKTLSEPLPPLESVESQLAAGLANDTEATANLLSVLDDPSPELLASLAERNRQHWEAWFDDPIPALADMTPREAAQTERGRDLLESLLCEYESRQAVEPDNLFTADIAALRRELGLK